MREALATYAKFDEKLGGHKLAGRIGSFAEFMVYKEENREERIPFPERQHLPEEARREYDQAVYYKGLAAEAGESKITAYTFLEAAVTQDEIDLGHSMVQYAEAREEQFVVECNKHIENIAHFGGGGVTYEELSPFYPASELSHREPPGLPTPPEQHLRYKQGRPSAIPARYDDFLQYVFHPDQDK